MEESDDNYDEQGKEGAKERVKGMMRKGVAYEVKKEEEMTSRDFKEDDFKDVPLVLATSRNMNDNSKVAIMEIKQEKQKTKVLKDVNYVHMKVYRHDITQWRDEAFHVEGELATTLKDVLKEEKDIC